MAICHSSEEGCSATKMSQTSRGSAIKNKTKTKKNTNILFYSFKFQRNHHQKRSSYFLAFIVYHLFKLSIASLILPNRKVTIYSILISSTKVWLFLIKWCKKIFNAKTHFWGERERKSCKNHLSLWRSCRTLHGVLQIRLILKIGQENPSKIELCYKQALREIVRKCEADFKYKDFLLLEANVLNLYECTFIAIYIYIYGISRKILSSVLLWQNVPLGPMLSIFMDIIS
jgi:hypothetical protein